MGKNQGLDKEKFVVGMPTYGRLWNGVDASAVKPSLSVPHTHGMYAPVDGLDVDWDSKPYHYIRQLVAGEGPDVTVNDTFTRYWDSVAQAPYVFDEKKGTLISYDDAESLTHKGIYAYQGGWGGAMTWAASSDYKTELVRVMYETAVEGKDWSTLVADPIAP